MNYPTSWSCFGRLWEKGQVECEGGFDLAYSAPGSHTKLRQRCSAYEACRQTKENKGVYQQQPQLVPPANLVRPQVPVLPAPPVPPPTFAQPKPPQYQPQYPQTNYQPQYPQQQQAPYYPYPAMSGYQVPPWIAQYGPQSVAPPYQQPGAQMPMYLTVPEPHDGSPWWLRLLNEVLRSVVKALGHSTASFFDHNPIKMHRPPQQPQPQQRPPN